MYRYQKFKSYLDRLRADNKNDINDIDKLN